MQIREVFLLLLYEKLSSLSKDCSVKLNLSDHECFSRKIWWSTFTSIQWLKHVFFVITIIHSKGH